MKNRTQQKRLYCLRLSTEKTALLEEAKRDPHFLGALSFEPWGNSVTHQDLFFVHQKVEHLKQDGFDLAHDSDFLWGKVVLELKPEESIEQLTHQLYAKIARFLKTHQTPFLIRTWHFIPHLLSAKNRYPDFCKGRSEGFGAYDNETFPAATVIGVNSNCLAFYFLATALPLVPIENDHQTSAFLYPKRYTATAPIFSRALLCPWSDLYISGTASILGSETCHKGSLKAQLELILKHLNHLIEKSALPTKSKTETLTLTAYVKNETDLPYVSHFLSLAYPDSSLIVLKGEICRPDLLVEIEARFVGC